MESDKIPLPMIAPTSLCLVGPPCSGKSYLTRCILEQADKMFTLPCSKVLYCYGEYLDSFESMKQTVPNLILHAGLPSSELIEELSESREHYIIVLDDLQESLNRSKEAAMLFTRGKPLILILGIRGSPTDHVAAPP